MRIAGKNIFTTKVCVVSIWMGFWSRSSSTWEISSTECLSYYEEDSVQLVMEFVLLGMGHVWVIERDSAVLLYVEHYLWK